MAMISQSNWVRFAAIFSIVSLFLAPAGWAQSQVDASNLLIPPGAATSISGPSPARANQQAVVWVKLVDAPLAAVMGTNAKKIGGKLDRDQQRAYLEQLRQTQNSLMSQI